MKTDTLTVQKRSDRGKLATRRLRREGRLPAVIYGHNEPSISLSISAEQLHATLRHGAKVVQLAGDLQGQALLQQIQWDTFAREVLHIDLLRVAKGELVKVEIEVVGRGDAPGENEGGIITWNHHVVEIEVAPGQIPERLHIDMTEVGLGDSRTAADILDLPEGTNMITPSDQVMVSCSRPTITDEEEGAVGTEGEPEVIKKESAEGEE